MLQDIGLRSSTPLFERRWLASAADRSRGESLALNIAHAIHGLGLGGAQKVIASIIRGHRRGDLNYFVYACEDGVHHQEIADAGATVRVIPRHLPKLDPLWAWRLRQTLQRDGIDLLHAHLFGDSLHGYLAARSLPDLPVVLTLHIGPEGWNGLQRRTYPWLLGNCQRAVACAHSVQANVQRAHPKAARVMETIANGIEVPSHPTPSAERSRELRQSFGLDDGAVIFATVGRLSEQKGYPYLVSAFAQHRRENPDTAARLVFLGEGELRRSLESQAAQEGAADHIVFAGFRDNIGELLEVIDVVVFSSLYEGLPIALLEAMAARRCLVVTDIPGNLDAVSDDREALVVPTAQVAPLAAAIGRVADDADLRRRLGEAAGRRFEERFTAQRMVERYEALYRRLTAQRAPAA